MHSTRCSSLTSITIPDSVTSIGDGTFAILLQSDQHYQFPDSVTSIGSRSILIGCSSLTSVTIPNSVTSIGVWRFRSVQFPDKHYHPRQCDLDWT